MDPRFSGDILKHLEKQNELLKNAYDSMSQELHKLQVEEEMLMRKFYELMSAQGLAKRNEGSGHSSNPNEIGQIPNEIGQITTLLANSSNAVYDNEIGNDTALIPADRGVEHHNDKA